MTPLETLHLLSPANPAQGTESSGSAAWLHAASPALSQACWIAPDVRTRRLWTRLTRSPVRCLSTAAGPLGRWLPVRLRPTNTTPVCAWGPAALDWVDVHAPAEGLNVLLCDLPRGRNLHLLARALDRGARVLLCGEPLAVELSRRINRPDAIGLVDLPVPDLLPPAPPTASPEPYAPPDGPRVVVLPPAPTIQHARLAVWACAVLYQFHPTLRLDLPVHGPVAESARRFAASVYCPRMTTVLPADPALLHRIRSADAVLAPGKDAGGIEWLYQAARLGKPIVLPAGAMAGELGRLGAQVHTAPSDLPRELARALLEVIESRPAPSPLADSTQRPGRTLLKLSRWMGPASA